MVRAELRSNLHYVVVDRGWVEPLLASWPGRRVCTAQPFNLYGFDQAAFFFTFILGLQDIDYSLSCRRHIKRFSLRYRPWAYKDVIACPVSAPFAHERDPTQSMSLFRRLFLSTASPNMEAATEKAKQLINDNPVSEFDPKKDVSTCCVVRLLPLDSED
jgi:hypothetical protein